MTGAQSDAAGQPLVVLGRVSGGFGVRGWIVVAGEGEALLACTAWRIGHRRYAVAASRMHSGRVLAKLDGIDTREAALALKGKTVAVPRSELPEPGAGRYYWADLIGLDVVNDQGTRLGAVQRLFSNGAHDVMELQGEGRTRLVPFVAAVVKQVDLAARCIEVEWGADW